MTVSTFTVGQNYVVHDSEDRRRAKVWLKVIAYGTAPHDGGVRAGRFFLSVLIEESRHVAQIASF